MALILLLLAVNVSAQDYKINVVLTGGENESIRMKIQDRLTDILNSLDNPDDKIIKGYFNDDNYLEFLELADKSSMYCVNVLYELKLINLPGNDYEVRNIRVRVDMQETRGNPDHYLVFDFNSEGNITCVRFAMEERFYNEIIEDGVDLVDFANRQKILQFIEIFRTAYNRKDIDYLKRAYSDDALIIVGKVLKKAPEQTDFLEKSYLTKDQIVFVKKSKSEYISSLEKVFKKNAFIKVDFDELALTRHHEKPEIYGVTLKQSWRSSSYSDEGYLFLMIDFINENQPLVHVRTWQPEKFPDGSTINLYDFNIID